MNKTKEIKTSSGMAILEIQVDNGTYARWAITRNGEIVVNQSESPHNPSATIEDMKQLIAAWEALYAQS